MTDEPTIKIIGTDIESPSPDEGVAAAKKVIADLVPHLDDIQAEIDQLTEAKKAIVEPLLDALVAAGVHSVVLPKSWNIAEAQPKPPKTEVDVDAFVGEIQKGFGRTAIVDESGTTRAVLIVDPDEPVWSVLAPKTDKTAQAVWDSTHGNPDAMVVVVDDQAGQWRLSIRKNKGTRGGNTES